MQLNAFSQYAHVLDRLSGERIDGLRPSALWLAIPCLLWLVRRIISVRLARRSRKAQQIALSAKGDYYSVFVGQAFVDEPFIFRVGLEFAMFRTYAWPSISGLLAETGTLCRNANLRYDITDLLIREMAERGGLRGAKAAQRINAIHAQHGDKISNEDMLFTLCALALEPLRWVSRFGTRAPLLQEWEASHRFWAEIGQQMGIAGFPPTLEETLSLYASMTERGSYAKSNKKVADATVALFVSILPASITPLASKVVIAMMGRTVRVDLGYPERAGFLEAITHACLLARSVFLSNLVFPLSSPRFRTPESPSSTGGGLCPVFHIYRETVSNYKVENLGSAPPGLLLRHDSSTRK